MRRPHLVLALTLPGLLSACSEQHRIETVLRPDGKVERAVYHPAGAVPAAARAPAAWQQVTGAGAPPETERAGWSGAIRDLPLVPVGMGSHFAAWGTFPSAGRIPEHLLIRAEGEAVLPPGRLARAARRLDYGLVVEHRWEETLTDIVTLPDLRTARDDLVTLLTDLVRDTFAEAVGRDYDAAPLVRWLRTEGKAWAEEVSEAAFVLRVAGKGPDTEKALGEMLLASAEKRGLVLRRGGRLLPGDDMGPALEAWLTGQLATRVLRKKDGRPAGPRAAADWVRDLKADAEAGPLPEPVFRPALEKVVARDYGGREALENRLYFLKGRIVGLHFHFPLGTTRLFHCTLAMPGEVVETNGRILGGSRVRWEFEAWEAWPTGYRMACRSLEPLRDVQKALAGRAPVVEREAMLALADLVGRSEGLDAVLRECRERKSLDPLYAHKGKDGPAGAGVLKLLGLPPP